MDTLIDLKTLAQLKDMSLIAKAVAEGYLHGHHFSVQRGVGIEFSQYRGYEQGDAPSRVDWKLFARSDKYFVREAERESELPIWFLLDSSASMLQDSIEASAPWNKLTYAQHLIASLSYLALKQGDPFGVLSMNENALEHLLPLSGLKHWHRLLHRIQGIRGQSRFSDMNQLSPFMGHFHQPGLLFVITDMYQHEDEVINFVKHIAHGKTEVVVFQLLCEEEISFNYSGNLRFEDRETGQQVLLSAPQARADYISAFERWQKELRNELSQYGATLHNVNINQPFDATLRAYLQSRNKLS